MYIKHNILISNNGNTFATNEKKFSFNDTNEEYFDTPIEEGEQIQFDIKRQAI